MKSVSGNHWEEKKFNKRLTDKIKIEKNFSELVANNKKILFSKFEYFSKISLNALNKFFLSDLRTLEPYGEGNQSPLFLIENIKIVKTKILKNNLISCYLKNKSGKVFPAISFNLFESEISNQIINNKNELNLIVQLSENFWNNKKNIQIFIIDILRSLNKA